VSSFIILTYWLVIRNDCLRVICFLYFFHNNNPAQIELQKGKNSIKLVFLLLLPYTFIKELTYQGACSVIYRVLGVVMETMQIKRAENCNQDEALAVKDLAKKLQQERMAGVIFFCSARYDLEKIADAVNTEFSCPVIGCTTAGEIGATYQDGGIVGISFSSDTFSIHTAVIENLKDFNINSSRAIVDGLIKELTISDGLDYEKMFGFLLIDGLSLQEEQVASCLHQSLEGVSLVGGSAGDDLTFTGTHVFCNGAFHSGVAAFTIFETRLPFKTFKFQHCIPSEKDMVITEADPSTRRVLEINGGPAAEELAAVIGIKKEELTLEVYSTNPVMLEIGDDWYVRSIQSVHDDGSITFACAIDRGLPLTVGEVTGLLPTLAEQISTVESTFVNVQLTLGCECIHRRLEIFSTGLKEEVESLLQRVNFVGFNTYGEQFNSIHVNQTLTCVVIGDQWRPMEVNTFKHAE
jgi:hypothetical protein